MPASAASLAAPGEGDSSVGCRPPPVRPASSATCLRPSSPSRSTLAAPGGHAPLWAPSPLNALRQRSYDLVLPPRASPHSPAGSPLVGSPVSPWAGPPTSNATHALRQRSCDLVLPPRALPAGPKGTAVPSASEITHLTGVPRRSSSSSVVTGMHRQRSHELMSPSPMLCTTCTVVAPQPAIPAGPTDPGAAYPTVLLPADSSRPDHPFPEPLPIAAAWMLTAVLDAGSVSEGGGLQSDLRVCGKELEASAPAEGGEGGSSVMQPESLTVSQKPMMTAFCKSRAATSPLPGQEAAPPLQQPELISSFPVFMSRKAASSCLKFTSSSAPSIQHGREAVAAPPPGPTPVSSSGPVPASSGELFGRFRVASLPGQSPLLEATMLLAPMGPLLGGSAESEGAGGAAAAGKHRHHPYAPAALIGSAYYNTLPRLTGSNSTAPPHKSLSEQLGEGGGPAAVAGTVPMTVGTAVFGDNAVRRPRHSYPSSGSRGTEL